jgi:catechol 2,3-dioxygenase-like lactoylglutathione lyase family enzyme
MNTERQIVPKKLAHVVIRTNHFEEMLAWYRQVFFAKTSYANPMIAFLTYDEEHHRIALLNTAQFKSPDQLYTGVDHVAFTYASLEDLLSNWERLEAQGITPFWCINHGPTTSIYYKDPDGNELEFQVDNFENIDDATAFFYSPEFDANPIGVDFDPALLLKKLRAGEPLDELLKRGSAPVPPGTEHVYTRLAPPPAA